MTDDTRGEADLELLETEWAVKLLALVCVELNTTIPTEALTPRLRELLPSAHNAVTNWCRYDTFEELARDVREEGEYRITQRLLDTRAEEDALLQKMQSPEKRPAVDALFADEISEFARAEAEVEDPLEDEAKIVDQRGDEPERWPRARDSR